MRKSAAKSLPIPRNDLILIKPSEDSVRGCDLLDELRNRIIAPDSAKEEARTGQILAIGPKVSDVVVGDVVLFPRYAGVEFKTGEDRAEWRGLRLMHETELLMKIEVLA